MGPREVWSVLCWRTWLVPGDLWAPYRVRDHEEYNRSPSLILYLSFWPWHTERIHLQPQHSNFCLCVEIIKSLKFIFDSKFSLLKLCNNMYMPVSLISLCHNNIFSIKTDWIYGCNGQLWYVGFIEILPGTPSWFCGPASSTTLTVRSLSIPPYWFSIHVYVVLPGYRKIQSYCEMHSHV